MSHTWRTAWHGHDIVIYHDDDEIDRVDANLIERVVFVYEGSGESPGDLLYAVVETAEECLLFPAETGFAGRVNFERVDHWATRDCVYWVQQSRAALPMRLRRGHWWMPLSSGPAFARLPRVEIGPLLDQWPLEGPQTWEQRKWRRIERSRPFSSTKSEPAHRARA